MFRASSKTLIFIILAFACTMACVSISAAQEFRVEGAGLEADPTSYSGPCPGLIKFKGKIQASAAGRVKYTYFYSDGATGPEGFVDFEGPGVKHVETSWRLGGASLTHFEGWAAIRILSPNSYESNRAKFGLDCKPENDKQPDLNEKQSSPQSISNPAPVVLPGGGSSTGPAHARFRVTLEGFTVNTRPGTTRWRGTAHAMKCFSSALRLS